MFSTSSSFLEHSLATLDSNDNSRDSGKQSTGHHTLFTLVVLFRLLLLQVKTGYRSKGVKNCPVGLQLSKATRTCPALPGPRSGSRARSTDLRFGFLTHVR